MIVAAIAALAEENGSSQAAIARRIEAEARGDLPALHRADPRARGLAAAPPPPARGAEAMARRRPAGQIRGLRAAAAEACAR